MADVHPFPKLLSSGDEWVAGNVAWPTTTSHQSAFSCKVEISNFTSATRSRDVIDVLPNTINKSKAA